MKHSLIALLMLCVYMNTDAQVRPFYKESSGISIRKKTAPTEGNFLANQRNSDKSCYTMVLDTILRKKFPSLGSLELFETTMSEQINMRKNINSRTSAVIYKIPVIVHIVHNGQSVGVGENISAAQVYSQFEVLNEDFRKKIGTPGYNTHPAGADMEIEFTPALYDQNGNLLPEPGINRINGGRSGWEGAEIESSLKPQTIWNTSKYFNVWTLRFTGSYAGVLGYAQFPSLSNLTGLNSNGGPASTDGVVCRFDAFGRVGNLNPAFNKGRTMTHEAGHWLGLRHIWGDVNNCSHPQDYCDDTPPVRDRTSGCPTGKNTCVTASPDAPDMIENYMDYTSDACMNIFTQNQKTRMRTVLEVSPRRKELINSNVQLPTNKPLAFFDASNVTICSGSVITFYDRSQNAPNTWKWDFINSSGTIVGTFYNQNQTLQFNTPGIYDVRLIVSNSAGSDTLLKRNYISVLSATAMVLPFNETVESTTGSVVLPNWILYNPDKDKTFQISNSVSGYNTGTRSIIFDNYDPATDLAGKIDALISNKLDLNTNRHMQLTFDLAYAQYDNDYNDTLALYYSTDCGASFVPFWFKGGKDLATAPNNTNPFAPTGAQWRTEKLSLSFLNGNSSVYIAFGNISGWGNRMYLDNIQFSVPSITQAPVTSFYASNTNVCQGGTVQFNDNSLNTPTSWAWELTGGIPTSSILQHPRIRYDIPGSYNVKLTASNTIGTNVATRSAYVNVIANPVIGINANKLTICEGDSILLKGTGGQNYVWYNDREDIIGRGDSIRVYPVQNTGYKVIGENSNNCKNNFTISVNVNAKPAKPVISLSGISLSVPTSASLSYQWYSNAGIITGATSPVYTPLANGLYYVVVTNTSGCSVLSDTFNYTITSTESGFSIPENITRIYPNPTYHLLNIESKGHSSVTLFSLQGNKLSTHRYVQKITLDMSMYSKGTYIAEIRNANGVQRKLIVLQ